MFDYEFINIPVEQLLPNPIRPRFTISQDKLLNLADSIRKYGLLQPILVGRTPAGLQIIAGERRWRAAKIAGLKEIPSIVVKASSVDLTLLFIEENTQREPMNIIEQAESIRRLISQYGFGLDKLAERLNRDDQELAQILKTLDVPEKVRVAYLQGKLSDQELFELADQDPLLATHQADS